MPKYHVFTTNDKGACKSLNDLYAKGYVLFAAVSASTGGVTYIMVLAEEKK